MTKALPNKCNGFTKAIKNSCPSKKQRFFAVKPSNQLRIIVKPDTNGYQRQSHKLCGV